METSEIKKPIKRNPNLVPLSREHHYGLLFAWKIKQGLAKNTPLETLRDYVIYFWNSSLEAHLNTEEAMLAGILPESNALQQQLLQEHSLIRDLVKQITTNKELTGLLFQELHALVTIHIRFEERSFFPFLESMANEEELEKIGRILTMDHHEPEDTFEPEFWISPK